MIHRVFTFLLLWAVLSVGFTFAAQTFAAGSSGGSVSTPSTNSRSLSPEQLSNKAFKSGVKYRDRALKYELKAQKASSEKSRDKALAKAQKDYEKAIAKQGEALKLFPQNYQAANELGYALRKTGDFRRAIGAYNYALDINPNFHQATEYRGEAFLALGFLDQTKQSYMVLFRNKRELADQLMVAFDDWLANKGDALSPAEEEFAAWIAERKNLAKITADLSMNNSRDW